MIRPDKNYQEIAASRLAVNGNMIAWRGKLDAGDSREAYVTHTGVPVASFWHESDAIRYVKGGE